MPGEHEDAALVAFCQREHPRLVGALSLYTNNSSVAEELAQEALLRAMEAWPRLRVMAAPGAWVHRAAMNLAKSWFRRYAAERRALRRLPRDLAAPDADVAAVLTVRAAVARLPYRQRRCVVMRHYLGYPVDVTAATLGISEQAVASLTYRAMQSLRQHVQEDPILEETPHAR